jgi:hypothetical protein
MVLVVKTQQKGPMARREELLGDWWVTKGPGLFKPLEGFEREGGRGLLTGRWEMISRGRKSESRTTLFKGHFCS